MNTRTLSILGLWKRRDSWSQHPEDAEGLQCVWRMCRLHVYSCVCFPRVLWHTSPNQCSQRCCVIWQLWSSDGWGGSHWPKTNIWGFIPSSTAERPALPLALARGSLASHLRLHLWNSSGCLSSSHVSPIPLPASQLSGQDPCDNVGFSWVTQTISPFKVAYLPV